MNPSNLPQYRRCPYCHCRLLWKRLRAHCVKVHGKSPPPNKREQLQTIAERRQARAAASQRFADLVENLKVTPRKCAAPGCAAQVLAPEEFCDSCKQKRLGEIVTHRDANGFVTRCDCGEPAMPGESRCYSCIGD
jgi:hypothetical protein